MAFRVESLNGCPCICHIIGGSCGAVDKCCEFSGKAWKIVPALNQAAATHEPASLASAEA
jgi:hypothetical protein